MFTYKGNTYVPLIVRDITERKLTETQLKEKNEKMEKAKDELDAFSYSVAHDLKSPLIVLKGCVNIIEKKWWYNINDEFKEIIEHIDKNIDKMMNLINKLLELSNINNSEINKEKIHISEMTKDIIDELRIAYPEREIKINIENTLYSESDKELTYIVLQNLLNNAWKYTKQIDNPTIEINSINENGNIVFCIKDNGIGFSMDKADRIFNGFTRLHSKKEYEGSGIGLYTVKRILDRHNGKIWVESIKNKGTSFYFHF